MAKILLILLQLRGENFAVLLDIDEGSPTMKMIPSKEFIELCPRSAILGVQRARNSS